MSRMSESETKYYMFLNEKQQYFNKIPVTTGINNYPDIDSLYDYYKFTDKLDFSEMTSSDQIFLAVLIKLVDDKYHKFRSKSILVQKIYDLLDPATYDELGIDITANSRLAESTSLHGRTNLLEILKSKNKYFIPRYDVRVMDLASRNGHVDVLQWWLDHYKSGGRFFGKGIKDYYSSRSMYLASKYNHIPVLNWWLNSGLDCEFNSGGINSASRKNNIVVLNWWKNSSLKLDIHCSQYTLEKICKRGHLESLNWWLDYFKENSKNPKCYKRTDSCFPLVYASINGHISLLEAWKNSGLELFMHSDAVDNVDIDAINVLNWWKNSGLPFRYTVHSLTRASSHNRDDILEWWKNSGLEMKYDYMAVNGASTFGHVKVLEWWKNSGLEFIFNNEAIYFAFVNGHVEILEWWKKSKLPYFNPAIVTVDFQILMDLIE